MIYILMFFWIILSSNFKPVLLIAGLASSFASNWFKKDLFQANKHFIRISNYWVIFIPLLMKEIMLASLDVAKIIWSKNIVIIPMFKEHDIAKLDSLSQVILANCITLTPGTASISLEKTNKILVHYLHSNFIEEPENISLFNKIKRLTC
jgi:multicomponent Na+:H+ antiporter subunit E